MGGIGRFWVSAVVARRFGERFPWGTLVVNVSGAAAIGVLAGAMLAGGAGFDPASAPAWSGLAIGVFGSYTTVSAFSLQTLTLIQKREPVRAAGNVVASLVLCLSAAGAGWVAAAHQFGG